MFGRNSWLVDLNPGIGNNARSIVSQFGERNTALVPTKKTYKRFYEPMAKPERAISTGTAAELIEQFMD